MGLCWLYEWLSDPVRGSGECASLWILGDESGLVVITGEDGVFLLLEMTKSMELELVDTGESELELPLLLPLDFNVVMEVSDSPVD